jgi:hypothetical protein
MVILMTLQETTIAKLQQLPEPLLQQVSDFIDFLNYKQQHSSINGNPQGELVEAWARWFDAVERLEATPIESTSGYQKLVFSKYRQQGLDL